MSEPTLSDLLQQVARADRAAFRAVYAQSAPKLAGVLIRMLGSRDEAEDVLQDVFIKVWNRAGSYDPARGQAMGWLIAIARNAALDRLRARPEARGLRRAEAPSDPEAPDPVAALPADGPDAEGMLAARGEAARVVACFGELEPDRAQAVRGAYLMGLSYAELAKRHGVPLNTMRTWLRRSLLRLRECLER